MRDPESTAARALAAGGIETVRGVEEHVRGLALDSTIVRASTFMEILLLPDFGLPEGRLVFFMRPDQAMQFIAVKDIGRIGRRRLRRSGQ